jgi:hypothetical protein
VIAEDSSRGYLAFGQNVDHSEHPVSARGGTLVIRKQAMFVSAQACSLDNHMVTCGQEALILKRISLTWITIAKLDKT